MSGASGSRRKPRAKGLLSGATVAAPASFKVLEVQGWLRGAEAKTKYTPLELSRYLAPRAEAAAAALRHGCWSAEQQRVLVGKPVCKDADVLDDNAEYHRAVVRKDITREHSSEILALSAGVAMYVANDGLTGKEAMAAFSAGKLVRSLLGDPGDLLQRDGSFRKPLADAVNGACSDDAHAESALVMVLVGANLPPGQNVYFYCDADDTVVQLSDAFRRGRVNTCIIHALHVNHQTNTS
jgi:hypothetical protein